MSLLALKKCAQRLPLWLSTTPHNNSSLYRIANLQLLKPIYGSRISYSSISPQIKESLEGRKPRISRETVQNLHILDLSRKSDTLETSPSTVEEYFFMKPEPTKEFPNISALPGIYANLSKSRLTMLVVLTSMGGYAMGPGSFHASTLALLSLGTALQSAAANATNQAIEVKYDTQMYRTRNRVLVRGLISRQHAAVFAGVSGVIGSSLLYYGVNPLVCYLGMLNYFLYTSVYTPMKRRSISNTWYGSVVGAIPPVMGWCADTGSFDMGALWLGSLLYIWQFPHFKALSWNIKNDYSRAGYQMSACLDPELCKRVAFRHTVFMTVACCLGPQVGIVTDMFHVYSLPVNLYGVYLGYKFYSEGSSKSSRKLFKFSLVQIPYLMVMMIIAKNWNRKEGTPNSLAIQEVPSVQLSSSPT